MLKIAEIDIDAIIKLIQSTQPQVSSPNKGIGKKCFIPVRDQSRDIVVEFFSESVVNEKPSNPEIGYVEDDVSTFRGVSIYVPGERKGASSGEVMPFDDFVEQYVKKDATKIALSRIMDSMEQSLIINEVFLEQANDLWSERDTGSKSTYKITYH